MFKNHILMDGISDMIFVVNVEGESVFTYEFINRAAMEKTGFTKEINGKTIKEVFPHKFGDFLNEQYNNVVTLQEPLTYEDSYECPSNGKTCYSSTELTPLFNDEHKCMQIVAVVKDVTKQKEAENGMKKAWEELNESKKRYQSLFHYNSDAIVAIDLEGRIIDGNIATENVTGYKLSELLGLKLNALVVDQDVNLVDQLFIQAISGNAEGSHMSILTKFGREILVTIKVTPLVIDDKVIGFYGILRDVTYEIESTRKLQDSEERFRIITENAHDLITLINEKGNIIYASPSYKEVLGKDYQEYFGQNFLHHIYSEDKQNVEQRIMTSIQQDENFQVQFRQYNQQKELVWCEAKGSPVFNEKGKFKYLVAITRDISFQKEYEEKLEFFALHDSLTKLPNRRYFKEKLEGALQEYRENHEGLAVIMIDIDNFKNYNDTFGHDVGDSVIEEFANRLQEVIGESNTVARLGGDEFVILLPSIGSAENVITIARSIKQAMRKSWKINGHTLKVTTSMGIAIAKLDITAYALLKNADVALYEAKSSGKSSFKLQENIINYA